MSGIVTGQRAMASPVRGTGVGMGVSIGAGKAARVDTRKGDGVVAGSNGDTVEVSGTFVGDKVVRIAV